MERQIIWKQWILGLHQEGKAFEQMAKINAWALQGQVLEALLLLRKYLWGLGLSSGGLWLKSLTFDSGGRHTSCFCQIRFSQHTVFAFFRTQNNKIKLENRFKPKRGLKNKKKWFKVLSLQGPGFLWEVLLTCRTRKGGQRKGKKRILPKAFCLKEWMSWRKREQKILHGLGSAFWG